MAQAKAHNDVKNNYQITVVDAPKSKERLKKGWVNTR